MNRSTIPAGTSPGHPFRRTLPARALRRLPEPEPEVLAAMERRAAQAEAAEARLFAWDRAEADASVEANLIQTERAHPVRWQIVTVQDVQQFLMAYVACLIAALIFLS